MVSLPNEQYANSAPAPDPFGILNGSSIKTLGFSAKDQYGQNISAPIGTSYTGTLADDLRTEQVRKYVQEGVGELDFWPDGRPKWQVIATLDTDYRDPVNPEDDGKRRIFFKSGLLQALQAEMRQKRIGTFGNGTRVTVTLTNLKPTAGFPKKEFNVDLTDVQPYIPVEQRQVQEVIAPQQPVQGAMTQWAQAPAQATAQVPQQTAPQGQPQQAPVAEAPVQPVQQPQPAASVQQPVPEAPAGPQIDQTMIDSFNLLVTNGIPEQAAIISVGAHYGIDATTDPSFGKALIQAAAI